MERGAAGPWRRHGMTRGGKSIAASAGITREGDPTPSRSSSLAARRRWRGSSRRSGERRASWHSPRKRSCDEPALQRNEQVQATLERVEASLLRVQAHVLSGGLLLALPRSRTFWFGIDSTRDWYDHMVEVQG